MVCFVDHVGYWTDSPIDVGDVIRADDVGAEQGINPIKDYVDDIYVDQALNWPGNVRFGACAAAGFDIAAPCTVVWDLVPGDTVYQTPGAHPQSEFQEIRDKLDWLWEQLCCTAYCETDNSDHYATHYTIHCPGDYGIHDADDHGDNFLTHYIGHEGAHRDVDDGVAQSTDDGTHYISDDSDEFGTHEDGDKMTAQDTYLGGCYSHYTTDCPANYVTHEAADEVVYCPDHNVGVLEDEHGTHNPIHYDLHFDGHKNIYNSGYDPGYDGSNEVTDNPGYDVGYDGTDQVPYNSGHDPGFDGTYFDGHLTDDEGTYQGTYDSGYKNDHKANVNDGV